MVALHPFDVFVTRSDTPHILEQVQTKCSIKLVWRRPPSNRSRETIFYVVSSESLDTDVLLGYQDSEQVHPNQMGRSVSGSQRGHGIITEERDQEIRPPAPTPPLQSMHPSDNPYDGHTYGTRVQQHQDLPQQQPHHAFLHGLFERPQMRDAVVDGARHSHNSPTPTVLDTRSIVTEHPQPLGPSSIPTMTATSSHNGGQSPGIDKIRLNFTWDKAPINVWLDMAAPAEAFYLAFHRIAEKRKKMFERDSVSIWLRRDKEMAEGDGYELLLNESDLEGDWETTITWLKENKRDTAPHVIGRVEIDGG
ncbi:hypothetical protein DE146DRAFT_623977 [Phaeosphaeria sp. MPI-PUGE-AT-0046c]|nr:hypothetical protein DE146DRAFT_623977 [Phaeosphaeria sp. MPI-PUGE-AT-0046c]